MKEALEELQRIIDIIKEKQEQGTYTKNDYKVLEAAKNILLAANTACRESFLTSIQNSPNNEVDTFINRQVDKIGKELDEVMNKQPKNNKQTKLKEKQINKLKEEYDRITSIAQDKDRFFDYFKNRNDFAPNGQSVEETLDKPIMDAFRSTVSGTDMSFIMDPENNKEKIEIWLQVLNGNTKDYHKLVQFLKNGEPIKAEIPQEYLNAGLFLGSSYDMKNSVMYFLTNEKGDRRELLSRLTQLAEIVNSMKKAQDITLSNKDMDQIQNDLINTVDERVHHGL